jgi:hypothetical protein
VQPVSASMASSDLNLSNWISRVQSAGSVSEVLALLDSFRLLEWSDEDRSRMAREYMRVLETLDRNKVSAGNKGDDSGGPDGPVWYEKM